MQKFLMIGVNMEENGKFELSVADCTNGICKVIKKVNGIKAWELYNKLIEKECVKHTFEFETRDDWTPSESACWVECPFSLLIKLGERCRFLDEEVKCPFIDKMDCKKDSL